MKKSAAAALRSWREAYAQEGPPKGEITLVVGAAAERPNRIGARADGCSTARSPSCR